MLTEYCSVFDNINFLFVTGELTNAYREKGNAPGPANDWVNICKLHHALLLSSY